MEHLDKWAAMWRFQQECNAAAAKMKEYAKWAANMLYYPWWDSVYEGWIEKLKAIGIYTDKDNIRFSGFGSQGDGASFTGTILLDVFWQAHGAPPEYLPLVELYRNNMVGAVQLYRYHSNYSHEYTVSCDGITLDTFPDDVLSSGVFAGQDACKFADEVVEPLLDEVEGWITDTCRVHMRELYDDLEEEYEYLTSE